MIVAATLLLSFSNVCVVVDRYRRQGYDDATIESIAHEKHVPERLIVWARAHCRGA